MQGTKGKKDNQLRKRKMNDHDGSRTKTEDSSSSSKESLTTTIPNKIITTLTCKAEEDGTVCDDDKHSINPAKHQHFPKMRMSLNNVASFTIVLLLTFVTRFYKLEEPDHIW